MALFATTRRALFNIVGSGIRPTVISLLTVKHIGTSQKNNDVLGEAAHVGASEKEEDFHGIASAPFPKEVIDILMAPIKVEDIEIKPDGILYLPEIKYRRVLNQSFGPGGWALKPRGQPSIINNEDDNGQLVIREYALYASGRYVSQSVGEHIGYGKKDMHTGKAIESAKSNALMRCCKDIGIASELWDPKFVSEFKKEHCVAVVCDHVKNPKERKKLWRLKSQTNDVFPYPWKAKNDYK